MSEKEPPKPQELSQQYPIHDLRLSLLKADSQIGAELNLTDKQLYFLSQQIYSLFWRTIYAIPSWLITPFTETSLKKGDVLIYFHGLTEIFNYNKSTKPQIFLGVVQERRENSLLRILSYPLARLSSKASPSQIILEEETDSPPVVFYLDPRESMITPLVNLLSVPPPPQEEFVESPKEVC